MSIFISDGEGKGFTVGVNDENQLKTLAVSHSIQHHNSRTDGNAYQVLGVFAAVNNETHTVLHLINDSSTRDIVVTYLRLNALGLTGGTAIPSITNYFSIGFGRAVVSGGSIALPANMNQSSGNTAAVTATQNNPTMTGTFVEVDRSYLETQAKENSYYKDGSVIIGVGETMEIQFTSDHTAGLAYARMSFIMVPVL